MTRTPGKRVVTRQRGVAILITIFALVLLSAVAMAMIFMSDTDSDINRNYRGSQRAYFGARAGLERVRGRLVPTLADLYPAVPITLPPSAGSVVYVLNGKTGEVVTPQTAGIYQDTEYCHEFPGLGGSGTPLGAPCPPITQVAAMTLVPGVDAGMPSAGTNQALSYKWVRMTLKNNTSANLNPACAAGKCTYVNGTNNYSTSQVCWNGSNEFVAAEEGLPDCFPPVGSTTPPAYTPVFVLTALAIENPESGLTTQQLSRRMVQMEVAIVPPFPSNAAVDVNDSVILNGTLNVNGYDYCTCNCAPPDKSGNVVCTDRGVPCDRTKWGIYSAGDVETPKSSEVIVGGAGGIAEQADWKWNIPTLIDTYKEGAIDTTMSPYDLKCSGGACNTASGKSFGTPPTLPPTPYDLTPATDVYYVPGSIHLTGAQGNGILIIDGDLEVDGGFKFYGLLLVKGNIKFTGGGSDAKNVNIYGAVMAGGTQIVDCNPSMGVCDTTLGGNVKIQYDRCALPGSNQDKPPMVISSREMEF